jgi:cellobiose phosphorylase
VSWDAAQNADAHHRYIAGFLRDLELDQDGPLGEFATLLPWFAHNALIHYLAPHGLEQFSGAAWGTRDACQGPLELLLAFRHDAAARDILGRVFAHQFEDGDFPQWFMFDEYADVYQEESHGDVPVWPLIALAQYLETTGDTGFLDERVPFRSRATRAATAFDATVADHVERILDHIDHHVVPGTRLYAYGDGDWDDTLQPARAALRSDMVSSWTIALLHQSLTALAATRAVALRAELAGRLAALAAEAAHGYRAHLVRDGVLAGFVHFAEGVARPIIHPADTTTGISYRLIPMSQSILAGMFTGEEAARHERLILDHLHYADGVRLMDRPAQFDDGRTTYFKRAEQSAFVGREVGLMYAHAHIRYAEALAALGRPTVAEELLRLSPVGLNARLPNALLRQRNCYFSSSDAVFPDRYEAAAHWGELRDGSVPVAGGWRVYSSGPGIYLRILLQHVLGVSVRADDVVFDPLLPADCPELTFGMELAGRRRTIHLVSEDGRDGVVVEADGVALASTPVPGAYRARGAAVPLLDLAEADTLTVRHGHPGSRETR